MNDVWKLQDGIFMFYHLGKWNRLTAQEIYTLVFGGSFPANSIYANVQVDLRALFPDVRFSKFSVTPELRLSLKDDKIYAESFFEKAGKQYRAPLPIAGAVDYGFAENTWCYFSGDFDQLATILAQAGITNEEISFREYVSIINCREQFEGASITDLVSGHLQNQLSNEPVHAPTDLKATLYPYQETGFKWLRYITRSECGCVLGDEMGLGKTLQVIALMVDRAPLKQTPYLVVAPLSLLENWRRELARFAPNLQSIVHHGAARTGRYSDLLKYDVVITSYGATISDLSLFEMIEWDLLVLDEAQNIKNPSATRTISIKQIPHKASIAVTGTPFENHLSDLWSILDFSMPGCLGDLSEFKSKYPDDTSGAEKVEPILSALMIRRKVEEVAQDLPDKIVIPQPLAMDGPEAQRYEDTRQDILNSFDTKSATLAALTKLRMYCCHPFLLTGVDTPKDPTKVSTKYARFCELVEEIVDQNEKVIVFTTYTDMFTIIQNDIPYRFNIPVDFINGSTPAEQRQEKVDLFSNRSGAAMLVLNPRAAGAGLNITAANHVIHYNLEWNPALEDQATARAFRRGQDKTVFVYRLYFADTVEEIVNQKISNKRNMSEIAVVGSDGTEDVQSLIMQALGMTPIREGDLL